MSDFCGEPVSALFLLYLNLILALFGQDARIRQALLKAVRTINHVIGGGKQGTRKPQKRPGKKERQKAFLLKKGKLDTEVNIKAKKAKRKQKLRERKKKMDQENKVKRQNNHQAVLQARIKELEAKLGLVTEKKVFKAKPCMSCISETLKFSPSVYRDKHFVEPNAFCFQKNNIKIKASLDIRSVVLEIPGYDLVHVTCGKMMKFLWQFSVVPCWNPKDQLIHDIVLANFKKLDSMWLESKARKGDIFQRATNEAIVASQRSVAIIKSCYPFVVASLYSSVESVGLTVVRGLTEKNYSPKNVEKTTTDILQVEKERVGTIPSVSSSLGVPPEVKPKSITALAKPVLLKAPSEKEERPSAPSEDDAFRRIRQKRELEEFSKTFRPPVEIKVEPVIVPNNRFLDNCITDHGFHPNKDDSNATSCWLCLKKF